MDTLKEGNEDRRNVLRLWPEWGPRDLAGSLPISAKLRLRLRNWNRIWQSVLDPVTEIRWPDAEVGRQWITQGENLVRELQVELGPQIRVVGNFSAYDPDASAEVRADGEAPTQVPAWSGDSIMMKFYILHSESGTLEWLLGQEDDGEGRLFGWLANTQRWYRARPIEDVFDATDYGNDDFTPIDAATVAAKLPTWPAISRHNSRWLLGYLASLPESDIRSSAEMGL